MFATLVTHAPEHGVGFLSMTMALIFGLGAVLAWPLMNIAGEPGGTPGSGGGATAVAPPPATQATPTTVVGQGAAARSMTAQEVEAVVAPLMQRIGSTIDAQLTPIRQAQSALETRLNELAQPTRQAASVFGGGVAPAGIVGELPGKAEARGYQAYRLMGFIQKSSFMPAEKCKYERDLSDRLRRQYVDKFGMQTAAAGKDGEQAFLVPLSPSMLIDLDDEASIQEEVRFAMAQGVRGASIGGVKHAMRQAGWSGKAITQTLSQFDDSALGIFTHAGPQGDMIELIRAQEVFSRAGASEITLPPNGRLPWPKQTSASTAYWVGESQQITESEPGTGSLEMVAKKLAALVKCPNELIRFGTPSVEAFLRMDMAKSMALKADRTFLDAVGSTVSPKGLLYTDGVNVYVASTTATDGDTFEPEDVGLMLSTVEELDHDVDTNAWSWVMRPKMWQNILNRRAGSGYAADDHKGPFLFPVNRSDITAGRPTMLSGHPVYKSTQVSGARTKGSGTDLTYILGGVFSYFMIGRVGVMELAQTAVGDTSFVNDQTWLRAIQHMDGACRYPNAFVYCDDLDMDLPAL